MTVPTTKTDIAKAVVSMIVARKASDTVEHVVTNTFDVDDESFALEIGAYAAGAYFASRVRPLTDGAVDLTVERYKSWRESRKATPAE